MLDCLKNCLGPNFLVRSDATANSVYDDDPLLGLEELTTICNETYIPVSQIHNYLVETFKLNLRSFSRQTTQRSSYVFIYPVNTNERFFVINTEPEVELLLPLLKEKLHRCLLITAVEKIMRNVTFDCKLSFDSSKITLLLNDSLKYNHYFLIHSYSNDSVTVKMNDHLFRLDSMSIQHFFDSLFQPMFDVIKNVINPEALAHFDSSLFSVQQSLTEPNAVSVFVKLTSAHKLRILYYLPKFNLFSCVDPSVGELCLLSKSDLFRLFSVEPR